MGARAKDELAGILERLREEGKYEPRSHVLELALETEAGTPRLTGVSTRDDLVAEVLEQLDDEAEDAVVRLPDERVGDEAHALVRSAIAPVYPDPQLSSGLSSQYVLGHRLDLLERREPWWRVRGEDNYVGWVHQGYLRRCGREQAEAWERGEQGEAVVSLGGTLVDETDRAVALLPWGARVVREAGDRFRLPDGRVGRLASGGEVIAADRLADRFPTRGESVIRTARRWMGTPYVWGGVVQAGADCSGYVQSVFWLHGIALPRDSDMQARVGAQVEPGTGFDQLRVGDLLYFSEHGERVTHVAISIGGARIIHSSLSNGGVAEDDLTGDSAIQEMLRGTFQVARRVLPD